MTRVRAALPLVVSSAAAGTAGRAFRRPTGHHSHHEQPGFGLPDFDRPAAGHRMEEHQG